MSDIQQMDQQARQKTVVAFVAGLLIGGLLVWVFSAPKALDVMTTPDGDDQAEVVGDMTDEEEGTNASAEGAESQPVGGATGAIGVPDQAAGAVVMADDIVYPGDEGWVGVRDYKDGELGLILGVVRFSAEQQLLPKEIVLQRATAPGETYATVFYTESGDRQFDPRYDIMVDGIMDTFMAQ